MVVKCQRCQLKDGRLELSEESWNLKCLQKMVLLRTGPLCPAESRGKSENQPDAPGEQSSRVGSAGCTWLCHGELCVPFDSDTLCVYDLHKNRDERREELTLGC